MSRAGSRNEAGEGGEGHPTAAGRGLGGSHAERDRMIAVQTELSRLGVSSTAQKQLFVRRDITAEIVRHVWGQVQRDGKAEDKVAVLVHRLRNRS